jgi:hypothetical protein
MRKFIIAITALCAIGVYAAQDATLTIKQVRDPVQLRAKLNANAQDAETRLVAGGMTNGIATMEGGATLDNTASASELNITETTVKVTGALTVTGTTTLTTKLAQSNIATNNLGALTLVVLSTDGKTNTLTFSAAGILSNNVITP